MLTSFSFSSLSFVEFNLDSVCFHPVFFLQMIRNLICILHIYTDRTILLSSEVDDLFQLLCVLSSVFISFPAEVVFRSRVIGACPVTTDCIVAIS